MNDITLVLQAIERGEQKSSEDLLPLVYEELRRMAAARLAREAAGQTLQATALVHVQRGQSIEWFVLDLNCVATFAEKGSPIVWCACSINGKGRWR